MHKVHYVAAGLGVPIKEHHLIPGPVVVAPAKCAAHSSAISKTLKSEGAHTDHNFETT